MSEPKEKLEATRDSYTAGFILSIVLTLIPFWIVIDDIVTGWSLTLVLMAFAVAQLFVQLIFFLHLGKEKKPKWNQAAFIFAMFFVVVLVIGSIWIMYNLDYNAHPVQQSPDEVEKMLIEDENYQR